MIRKVGSIVLAAGALLLALALGGCAAGNTGAKLRVDHVSLPSFVAAAPVNLPPPCPAEMRVPPVAEPTLPDQAFFPAPENDAAAQAVQAYFSWLHSYAVWARAGWARAADAQAFCSAH